MPLLPFTTLTMRNDRAKRAIHTPSRQHHPHPESHSVFPSCAYHTCSAKQAAARSVLRHDRYDVNAIFESPFHLHPPVPERHSLISPKEASPSTGDTRTRCRPTRRAVGQPRTKREQVDRYREGVGGAGGALGDVHE